MEPPTVVLDACVIYPMPLCDTLLRVAEDDNDLKSELVQLLTEQSQQLSKPPISFDQLLQKLEKQVPNFVSRIKNWI